MALTPRATKGSQLTIAELDAAFNGLDTAVGGKAAASHTHAQSDIISLVADLAGKSSTSHTHVGVYCPVTSGTALLKGNGTGGTAAAVSNTDYAAAVHASRHEASGADALSWTVIHGRGSTGSKPTAAAGNAGYLYFDTTLGKLQRSTGAAWEDVSESVASVPWGSVTGTLANQTDLQAALDGKSATSHTHTGVYAPATSGTSILKGNGSGGFSNAVANTDYPAVTHAARHEANGADTLAWTTIHGRGTTASKPAAAAGNAGYLYFDTTLGKLQRSTGAAWEDVSETTGGASRVTFSDADATVSGTGDQYICQIGTMSAARTVTLPPANGRGGQRVILADESGSVTAAYSLILARSGSDTIDGQTSVSTGVPYGRLDVISDGTSKWTLIRSRKRRQEFTSNGTWTAPAGVTCVTVTCVGGGGGGGEGGATNGGGGGGAGAVVVKTVDVSPGTGYTVTIGATANGAAQSGTPATGTDGNTTSFGTLVYAYGGKGGQTAYGFYAGSDLSIFAPPGTTYYGLPGTGTISPSSGSAAANANSWWGNAGAAAGTGGTASQRGGAGGTGYGGSGGVGGNGGGINAGGNAAANSGAGGGGGGTNGTTCGAGGNGGSGLVIVEWVE